MSPVTQKRKNFLLLRKSKLFGSGSCKGMRGILFFFPLLLLLPLCLVCGTRGVGGRGVGEEVVEGGGEGRERGRVEEAA